MKTNEALKTLDMLNKFKVIGMLQYRTLREFILQSEESDFFATTVDEVANRVADMPNLYAQDGEGKKAIAHLHYFLGNYDAWITELNLGTRIAFGKASFEGHPRLSTVTSAFRNCSTTTSNWTYTGLPYQ